MSNLFNKHTLVSLTLASVLAGSALSGMAVAADSSAGHTMAAGSHAGHAMSGSPSSVFAQQMMDMHAAMSAFEQATSQEAAFIMGMIPHHQTAIAMAQVLAAQTKDPVMSKLASDIISAQTQEIAVMQKLLAEVNAAGAANVTTAGLAEAKAAYTAINDAMHQAPAADDKASVDVAFIKSMVPHHQGAIDMAKVYLKYGKHPELTKMCNDIISAQTSEIELMNSKL